MKQFFKTMFASALGVFLAGWIGMVLFFIAIIAIVASTDSTSPVKDNSILKLNLNTSVVEVKDAELNDLLNVMMNDGQQPLYLIDIINSISQAKTNTKIKGIYLNTDNYVGSYAISSQIRSELVKFKESGKFIIAYNNYYTQNQYFLSTVADSIYVNPLGGVSLTGLSSKQIFFKNTLDKLGVKPEVFRVGTFKSAIEPFILDKMSDANRLQVQTFLGSIWDYLDKEIAQSRNLAVEDINALADSGIEFSMANEIKDSGLFTRTKYAHEVNDILKTLSGVDEVRFSSISDLSSLSVPVDKAEIALLCAEGEIVDAKGKGIYAPKLIKEIYKIQNDDNIKGVIFRVNSPGGSAFASEQIWKAISDLKKVKPVVVSMGNYAASGGYYISCDANYIIAEPSTLTGSIGVFGLYFNANKLFTKDFGFSFDEVKTNKFGQITIFEPIKPAERALIQNNVENIYDIFLKRCSDGRGIPVDSIAKIAEGRVWSGVDALNIGLIDALGGIDEAKLKVEELTGLQNASVTIYPQPKSLFESLMSNLNDDLSVKMKQLFLGDEFNKYLMLRDFRNKEGIQARMPDMIVE